MIWNNSSIFLFSDNLTKFSNQLSPNHLAQLFLKNYKHLAPLPYKIFSSHNSWHNSSNNSFFFQPLNTFLKKLFRSPDNLTKLFIFFLIPIPYTNSLRKSLPINQQNFSQNFSSAKHLAQILKKKCFFLSLITALVFSITWHSSHST